MLKIQFVSDLHLEFIDKGDYKIINPTGDILILAGDIVPGSQSKEMKKFIQFLNHHSPKFLYIFHVPGNHEYWSGSQTHHAVPVQDICTKFRSLRKMFPNYYFMNRGEFRFTYKNKKYLIIGATLWTKIPKPEMREVQSQMRDYTYIWIREKGSVRKLLPEDTYRIHMEHSRFITKSVRESGRDENIILITHHKPTVDLGRGVAYETDMTGAFLKPPIKLAIHGHTHVLYNKNINGVKVVSNPKGYHGSQNTGFKTSWTISI